MTISFTATYITVKQEENCLIVGLADQQYHARDYVMLQRAYEFDEQDSEMGMDNLYIERGPDGQAVYGGINRVVVDKSSIRILLSNKTASILECDNEIMIHVIAAPQDRYILNLGLAEICKDKVDLILATPLD